MNKIIVYVFFPALYFNTSLNTICALVVSIYLWFPSHVMFFHASEPLPIHLLLR